MPAGASDRRWMSLALALGRRGLGRTWPNPSVGCVIVKEGRVLGRGHTASGGRPHAETLALKQAGAAARGATAYVTLEPCAHHGQTPPCASALVEAGISRAVTALSDPDPRVAGKGHAILRAAGVRVDEGCLRKEAEADQAGFLSRIRRGRPMLSLKLASSFDGRIATSGGESRWITGPAARRMVHLMRARHDAVLIGVGTARADDPRLDQRGLGIAHQPVRVVADSGLSCPRSGKLAESVAQQPLWLCHGPGAPPGARAFWQERGARLIECGIGPDGRLDMKDMLAKLGAAGLTRVFCEGGGQLAASLLAAGLVDRLIGFTAGLALGAGGTPAVAALPEAPLAEAPRFRLLESRPLAGDLLHVWAPVPDRPGGTGTPPA